ncbi:MAG: hypothetical protein ACLP01_14570 [Solirubrobacteraceae bacterium]
MIRHDDLTAQLIRPDGHASTGLLFHFVTEPAGDQAERHGCLQTIAAAVASGR